MLKRFCGPILVVVIVSAVAGLWNYSSNLRANAPAGIRAEFSDDSLQPRTPQDHILLGRKMDINTATKEMFEALPGIGPSIAESIVEYRERHGPFGSIHELESVKGVGPRTVERLVPYLR